MPYALYSTTTGIIANVLYQQPTSAPQLAALTAAGMAFVEVASGISSGNCMIDLATGQPVATGPAMTYVWQHSYDTTTGQETGSVGGNVPTANLPVSKPGLIVSPTQLPIAGKTLVLDANGNPTTNPDGSCVVVAPPTPDPPLLVQLTAALIANGTITSDQLGANTVTAMNTSLAVSNMAAIAVTAQPAKSVSVP